MKNPWVTAGSAPCATQPHPALGGHADDHRFTTGQQGGDGAETSPDFHMGFPMVFLWFTYGFQVCGTGKHGYPYHISYWYLYRTSTCIIIYHHLSSSVINYHHPPLAIYQHLSASISIYQHLSASIII